MNNQTNLINWYDENTLLNIEWQYLQSLLSEHHGDYLAIINYLPNTSSELMFPTFRETFYIHDYKQTAKSHTLQANYTELPIIADIVNCVVVQHVFDFQIDTEKFIKELARITAPEGYVYILGSNRFSLFGVPKCIRDNHLFHFVKMQSLRKKMLQHDFVFCRYDTLMYRPYIKRAGLYNKLAFLELLGRFAWPHMGAIYIMCFQKKVLGMTPQKVKFKEEKNIVIENAQPVV